ncbi:MAG: OmpA family protein [Rhodopila sp.]|nr:OmpA family protein [Rhodopila sp.]
MQFRNALVAATILALPLAANAQPITGLYVGGAAGVNIMQDENVAVGGGSGSLNSRVGPAVSLSLGYGLGNGLRAEVEGDWRHNNFSGASGAANGGGTEQKYGAMVNVLYDFVGLVPVVQPYVGVGVGYQWVKEDNLHIGAPGFAASAKNDAEGAFAYQAIIGASMPVAGVPGLSLTADYRFMGLTGDRTYEGRVNGKPANFKLDDNYNHAVMFGVRYAFGAAPAPAPVAAPSPAAVPASPVSRSYLVFFDWDKADLTDRARQIVSEAAANSTKVQYTRLEVNGYTDASGTPKYNQGLSVRRAQAVAAELVKDGVPRNAITIQGFGDTHPLVPTGAGVREPQNRRVEIIIK